MAGSTSIRIRRGRKRILSEFELQLTSLLDILVIILVFLLKSYSVSTNSFTTLPDMHPPLSTSPDVPPDSLHLIITPEALTFEDQRIAEFEQTVTNVGGSDNADYKISKRDLSEGGRLITPLYDALVRARNKAETLRAKSTERDTLGRPLPFSGVIAIQADKRVSYDILRRVMYTAGAAEYKIFRLLAIRKEE